MSSSGEAELLHTFKGIPFTTRSSPELLKSLDTFDAREDDVLLVSYPKSGTHWLAGIITKLYNTQVTITSPIELGDISQLEELNKLSSKRIIPTHLDYNMLPPNFKNKKCKIIYISRNPKDTAVSMFHYYRDNPNLPTVGSWTAFFDLFLKGNVVCGSWFDHFLSWEEHEDEKNILFLFYEDMKKDLPKVVKEITLFLSLNVSDDDIQDICKKSSFSEMKNDTEKQNSDPSHTVCALTSDRKLIFRKGHLVDQNKKEPDTFLLNETALITPYLTEIFLKKEYADNNKNRMVIGAVGDWKNYFTPKQNITFQEIFNEKMKLSKMANSFIYEC